MPSITIRIDEDTADQIDRLADAMDRSRAWIAGTALKRYLQDESRWLADIQAGIAELDRGEAIPHEEVMSDMRAKIDAHSAKAKR